MMQIGSFVYWLYGITMYFRWRLSHYDHVGKLISLMVADWRQLKILDVGSGTGKIASDLRIRGVDITCVDINKSAIKKCRRKGLKALCMDIREIPKKYKGEFDVVWCLDILEHLEKKKACRLLSFFEHNAKKQILVFIPLGYFPQDMNIRGKIDKKYSKHRSYWKKEDFIRRGYRCKVLKGYHFDIRLYCSSLVNEPYSVVRDAMWAVKEFKR